VATPSYIASTRPDDPAHEDINITQIACNILLFPNQ